MYVYPHLAHLATLRGEWHADAPKSACKRGLIDSQCLYMAFSIWVCLYIIYMHRTWCTPPPCVGNGTSILRVVRATDSQRLYMAISICVRLYIEYIRISAPGPAWGMARRFSERRVRTRPHRLQMPLHGYLYIYVYVYI